MYRPARLSACLLFALPTAAVQAAENLLLPLPEHRWDHRAAIHLLRRAAFEGTPAEVQRLSRMSLREAVEYLVDYDKLPQPQLDPQLDSKLAVPPPRAWLRSLDEENRQRYLQTRRIADRLQMDRIRGWWLQLMVTSPRQLQEKMTLFWHGHFTSDYRKVRSAHLLYRQNQLFRRQALGNYRQLLLEVSADPAMLIYLDSATSNKRRPNENYARELMELFTLGEGHYTENDVKEAARAFSGWSVADGQFTFRRRQHDFGDKLVLGRLGPWTGQDVIDIILAEQQARRFIVRKLWALFCYDDPEKSVVDGLSAALLRNKYELRPVVRTILSSRGFYSARSRGTRIKSPVQLVAGTLRLLGVSDYDYLAINQALAAMGQQLFQPPNVRGWVGGQAWINTATLFQRYNFAGAVIGGHSGHPQRGQMNRMRDGAEEFGFNVPARRSQIGLPPYDPRPLLLEARSNEAADVVSLLAERLLAVPLPPDQRRALVAFLGEDGTTRDPSNSRNLQRLRTTIHLLMSTPEYQVY